VLRLLTEIIATGYLFLGYTLESGQILAKATTEEIETYVGFFFGKILSHLQNIKFSTL
jgi:hypothetical protein